MSAPALRPLRVGEILDASIKIYKSNARTLIGLAAVVVVPVQIFTGLVLISIVPNASDLPNGYAALTGPQPVADQAARTGATLVLDVTGVIAGLLVTAACVKAVSDVYLDQPTDFGSSLRFALRRLPALLWLTIVFGVLLVLAFIALILPGIYFYGAWAVSTPVLLIEGTGGYAALRRSRALVRDRWWPTAAAILVATLLVGVIIAVFQGVLLAIVFSTSDSVVVGVALVMISGAIAAVITQPFQAAVRTVLYYDLRVRKEGYDVELLAEQLGIEAAALPGPGYLGPESVGRPGGPPFWPPPPGWTPPADDAPVAPTAVAEPMRPTRVGPDRRGRTGTAQSVRLMAALLATGGLGGTSGATAARQAAKDILAENRFHAGPIPRPLHGFLHAVGQLWQPIGRRIADAFDSVAGVVPGGSAVLWTILAAVILLAAVALTARSTRRVLRETGEAGAPGRGARVTAESLERAAVAAERAGRLQEAVRLRFQAGLMRLAERDVIDPAASTPNAQLRRTLRSTRFDALAGRFDEIVYGGDEAREQDVEDARREWALLVGGER